MSIRADSRARKPAARDTPRPAVMNGSAALERSRSGNGGHVWFFFEDAIPATLARKLGSHILTETMEWRPELGLTSYDRLFPNHGPFSPRFAVCRGSGSNRSPTRRKARGVSSACASPYHLIASPSHRDRRAATSIRPSRLPPRPPQGCPASGKWLLCPPFPRGRSRQTPRCHTRWHHPCRRPPSPEAVGLEQAVVALDRRHVDLVPK